LAAAEEGDHDGLETLLADDASLRATGPDKTPADRTCAPRPRQRGAHANGGLRGGSTRFGGFISRT
jgi:hypothetical protein